MPLLALRMLEVYFKIGESFLSRLSNKKSRVVHAVDGIDLEMEEGETVALVGESGSGKTTTGKVIAHLLEPTRGEVTFQGRNIFSMSSREVLKYRRQAQMIFQDSLGSLDPRFRARDIIAEPFKIHKCGMDRRELDKEIKQLLETVGLLEEDANKYSHEFSGGQARRLGVARALALHPRVVVCDEPTTGLDVSVAAKILNFMANIQQKFNLTYIWISHNMHVVRHVSDRVAIMYLGKILEIGHTYEVFENPLHPYTRALLSAAPGIEKSSSQERILLHGEIPSPINPPAGCRFYTRCYADTLRRRCEQDEPPLIPVGEGHLVACWKYH